MQIVSCGDHSGPDGSRDGPRCVDVRPGHQAEQLIGVLDRVAAPGDVLVGSDQHQVGAVARAKLRQVAQIHQRSAVCPVESGLQQRVRIGAGRKPDQGQAIGQQVVDGPAVGQPGMRQPGARDAPTGCR